MRDRDTQRKKLYAAEWASTRQQTVSKLAQKHLSTIQGVEIYVHEVQRYAWFQRRWSQHMIQVERGRGTNALSSSWMNRIRVAKWGHTEHIVLHELAHILTPNRYAAHGPEFAGVLLFLVRRMMGKEAAAELRAAFKAKGVRVSKVAVPKPSRPVTPRRELRKRATA